MFNEYTSYMKCAIAVCRDEKELVELLNSLSARGKPEVLKRYGYPPYAASQLYNHVFTIGDQHFEAIKAKVFG